MRQAYINVLTRKIEIRVYLAFLGNWRLSVCVGKGTITSAPPPPII